MAPAEYRSISYPAKYPISMRLTIGKGSLAHGVDLVDVERFGRWLEDPSAKLHERFTSHEREHAAGANEIQHLAGCFAAKEAVLKTLGLGAGDGIPWREIELDHDEQGAPFIKLSGRAERACAEAGIHELLISLTHTAGIALASVIGWRAGE